MQRKTCSFKGKNGETCSYPIFSKKLCKFHHKQEYPEKYEIKPKKTTIKKISDKQSERLKKYNVLRKNYLWQHKKCEVENCCNPATEIHHKAGRIGENLFKHFLAVCRVHHLYIEENPTWAKENGYSVSRL